MFAYSVVLFSSSAYLFYHSWKYLSTHFLQRASVFRTIPVASFVFLCRKYIFTQSKANSTKKTSVATLSDCYALYQLNVLMSRGLTIYCFFWRFFVFRELNKTTLLVKAPSQIIVTAVHVTRSALTRHKIMSIGGFDNLSAQFALDSILDDLLHIITSTPTQYHTNIEKSRLSSEDFQEIFSKSLFFVYCVSNFA